MAPLFQCNKEYNLISMNILIVEDEGIVALDIAEKLQSFGYTVDGIAATGSEALLLAQGKMPDLVLMDIHIRGELDGIQTASMLRKIAPCPIIYLTALTDKDTVERARNTEPEAYLVKPFRDKELQIAIDLALFRASAKRNKAITSSSPFFDINDRVFVRQSNHYERIFVADIIYLEAARAYCDIHTTMKKYTVASSLAQVLGHWLHPHIKRIHKSYAVNIKNIQSISGNVILLNNSFSLPIGQQYRSIFLDGLNLI